MGLMASAAIGVVVRHTAVVRNCSMEEPPNESYNSWSRFGQEHFLSPCVTDGGKVVFNRTLRRAQFLKFFECLEPCLVGIETCGTSHHWARELIKLSHNVKLIPPIYVKPYVKRGKSDAADAEAICEAVTRPTMRFVEIKTPDQQAILALHRTRDLVVRQRTQTINMLRAQLAEFGIVFPQGVGHAIQFAKRLFDADSTDLPDTAGKVIAELC